MMACLGSLFGSSAGHDCPEWPVPLLLAIGIGFILLSAWLYKITAYRNHNLQLRILNRLPIKSGPPLRSIAEPPSLKIIGTGEQRLFVEVRSTGLAGFPLKSFNFRCVQLIDVGAGKPAETVVPIIRVTDPIHAGRLCMFDDGHNGIDGDYSEIRKLGRRFGKNRSLHFEVVIKSLVEWTGYLNFTGKDSTGFCSYGRYAIAVRNNGAPLDKEMQEARFQSRFDAEKQRFCTP
ncbi:MAG: hypothetical protein KGS09_20065 [Nitrospirae bacterium]|nr:hypothetical protein [Nitrospirota bacterium]